MQLDDATGTPGADADFQPYLIPQDYDGYTAENHEVWSILYQRRMDLLPTTASAIYMRGIKAIGLDQRHLPNLNEVNARLGPKTGWYATPVSGYLPAKSFFAMLAQRKFPTTTTIRTREQIAYLEAPDIFHDVFGHVPLHADPIFADFLQRTGEAGLLAETDEQVEQLARLFWFTIEFGLIREHGEIKLYGSGLISSPGEAVHALTDAVEKRPFKREDVIQQPFEIDHYQPILFVVESFDDLFRAMDEQATIFREANQTAPVGG